MAEYLAAVLPAKRHFLQANPSRFVALYVSARATVKLVSVASTPLPLPLLPSVGEVDGAFDGALLGELDGTLVGAFDGALLGKFDGALVGAFDGALLGKLDGALVSAVGALVAAGVDDLQIALH